MLVFISNRSGIDNMYLSRDSGGRLHRKAPVQPALRMLHAFLVLGRQALAFSLFEDGGWDDLPDEGSALQGHRYGAPQDPLHQNPGRHHPQVLPAAQLGQPVQLQRRQPAPGFPQATDSIKTVTAKKDSTEKIRKAKASAEVGAAIAKDSADFVNRSRKDYARPSPPPGRAIRAAKAAADSAAAKPPARNLRPIPRASDSALANAASPGNPKADTLKKAASDDCARVAAAPTGKAKSGNPSARRRRRTPFLTDSSIYLAEDGSFRKNRYRPVWSLDNANAALGIDNQYGYGGLAYITLSDLMGDQELSFALSINGSWENTNGAVVLQLPAPSRRTSP